MLLRGLFNQSKEIEIFSFSNLLSCISLGAILVSIILFSILGLNYGIDFRGGTMFMVSSSEKIKVSDVRNTLSGSNLGDVSISQATNPLETLSAGTLTSIDNIFIKGFIRACKKWYAGCSFCCYISFSLYLVTV